MRPFAAVTLAIALVALATPSGAWAQDPYGRLAGCVSDMARSPLPGVTIRVTGANVDRTVTSETDGCFRVGVLPPGTYLLFATLPGFSAVTQDELAVRAGALTRVDFRMRVASICECLMVAPPTVPSLWAKADVVAQIRIGGHDYGPEDARVDAVHTATVLRVWKDTRKTGEVLNTLRFVQIQSELPVEPYAVGQEFILFLTAKATDRPFTIAGAFALENGRVRSASVAGYQEKSTDDLVTEIVALIGR
jgi:hypothetical protein